MIAGDRATPRTRRAGPRWRLALVALVAVLGHAAAPGGIAALSLLANADSYSVVHDRVLSVAAPGVLGNDVVLLGSSTAVLDSGPAHGSLSLSSNGAFTYTPAAGYVGTDTFRYHAHDGLLNTLPATVTITVTNSVPVARDDAYSASTGVTLTVPARGVLGNDSDGDGDRLSASLVDGSGNGSLDLNADGSFTFKSGGSFSGDRTFTYRATDGLAWSTVATVTIHVGPSATATPRPTPTPTPSPPPTLPLPSLPLPTLPAVTLPPLPELSPIPTIPLPTGVLPSPAPSGAGASPSASPAGATGFPPPGGGGISAGGGPATGGEGAARRPGLTVDGSIDSFDGIGAVVFGGLDWAVPGLALTVPGLLLLLALAAQGGVGIFSLPLVRRWLGQFGLWRRRGREARPG